MATITLDTPEMVIEELGKDACDANFRGGLGIFGSDNCEGFSHSKHKLYGFLPFFHRHWLNGKKIHYENTPARHLGTLEIHPTLRPVDIFKIKRANIDIFGIHQDIINDVLYTGDRWKRLQQHVTNGHAAPMCMKQQGIKPDISWINESHSAIAIPVILEDPYFRGVKILFTTHTPVEAGMEKFDFDFNELRISEKYRSVFMHNGRIDLNWGGMSLAHLINTVSEEHCQRMKEMFPEFAHKMVNVTNGSGRNSWMSPRLKALGDNIDLQKLAEAHRADKADLIDFIHRESGIRLDPNKLLMAWTRRLTNYKRQYPMLAPVIDAICADRNTYVDTPLGKLRGCGIQHLGVGVAHETERECQDWVNHFNNWTTNGLKGRFVFIPSYGLEFLKRTSWGADIWFSCPRKREEACGTSEERAQINGNPNITVCTGGMAEHVEDFDPINCSGNGLFIEPDEPIHLYYKSLALSDLYYDWTMNGNNRWLRLRMNAFETGKKLDATIMAQKYEAIFEKLLQMP
ncbi:hypothetical protein A2303_01905 [Candidatus Falkowbacteria bacterium RIFOXYB2_FULL_47_14]|uniref:starch synthase n=1 Tax=Candidatus Falkowbacteria bacterium RIFOXYA2_FULL_47_19 TaxID=1797994 RepID=A0A1F5SNB1_9BACT|nr:MAG: hypothetical protein A2227_06785 [Candidatus Falkowbacteria bacterium RIFOXYA2_FULL_47_19]OGF34589.1 MAG: hypothetical protein A2468_07805 [Candidatus Falkowbacteria bacterium RIFOXYC2_FULL_46_15]OGF43207.1 MAG: hypothetical protein A2303_01905 [Candidatus Falkowbacteria bacterium RIFOXYB2_FULL_47_14]